MIPVVVVDSVEQAVPLARALVRGGIPVIEITLRSAAGLGAIEAVAAQVEGMVVGAGTVVTPAQVQQVKDAGAQFIVTPGSPPRLLDAALASGLPLLAGAGTLTEMLTLAEAGLEAMKFFPAEASGGRALPLGGGRSVPAAAVLPDGWHHARRRPPPGSRCPTSAASAGPGSRRRTLWRKGTGPGSRPWRLRPPRCGRALSGVATSRVRGDSVPPRAWNSPWASPRRWKRFGVRRGRPARPTGCGELLGIAPDGGPRAVEVR